MEIMKKVFVTLATATLATLSAPAQAGQQCGEASYYGLGDGYHGGITASGRRFDTWSNQAAHKSLPFGTVVTVKANGRSTQAVITDRGPYAHGRIIDLSAKSFGELGPRSRGVHNVCIYWQ